MLTPDTRTVLLDDLQAPPGYEVDHAVATTFTLDLSAAMLPPFAISGIGGGSVGRDPIALLQALRRASDKVDIFCQAGSIAVPRSADLVAFLEPMIHQVVPPRGGLFHPKLWLLRFTAPDAAPRFRLLVLSRNLTHDNTWDIAVRLDSESLDDSPQETNRPLTDLIRWLTGNVLHIAPERRQRLERLADEVAHVHWEHPDHVRLVIFHVSGIPDQPTTDFWAGGHLVISPFVTEDGLAQVTRGPKHKKPTVLVSRQETLDALPAEALDGITAFTLAADTELPSAEDEDSDGEERPAGSLNGLHAKVYVLEPTDRWAAARVLMGSSNATGRALTRNVEFLVEVFGKRAKLGIDQVLPLDASQRGLRPLVEPYVRQQLPDQTEDKAREHLQRRLREIAAIPHCVVVKEDTSGASYSATVSSAAPYPAVDGVTFTIHLLSRPGVVATVEGSPHLVVTGLTAADITPCIAVTARDGKYEESTVLLGQLVGAPEGRLDAVVANQINDKDKFRRLLLLLLSLGNPAELAALLADRESGDGTAGFFGTDDSGILELVLRALASGSSAITDLDGIVAAVDPSVLPEGFEPFWEEVRQARELIGEESA